MQEEISMDDRDIVKSYMESVKQLEFNLRNQPVRVNIMKYMMAERPGGMDLVYKYQLSQ